MHIHGKLIRIVESHEEVLLDWAEARRAAGRALTLVTLDRHTDTAPALRVDFVDNEDEEPDDAQLARWQKRVLMRFRDAEVEDLDELVKRLENDEHIDAALRLGILDRALIVSSQEGRTGDATTPGAKLVRPECAPDCADAPHGSAACARRRFDAQLESATLGPALTHLGFETTPSAPYVLDIDLDTFATRRGLAPDDAAVFHELIRGACLITIAREPEYVSESLDDHDADEIEAAVLAHITQALGAVS